METARLRRRSKLAKWAYGGAGAALFSIGAVGIVTPGLPTTIFWILATGCLLKARPGAVRPILRTPYIGPIVKKFVRWRPFGGGRKKSGGGAPHVPSPLAGEGGPEGLG